MAPYQLDGIEKPKRHKCHWWPLIFTVIVIVGGIFSFFAITKTGPFGTTNKNSNYPSASSSSDGTGKGGKGGTIEQVSQGIVVPSSCPDIPPNKRYIMFWQSEVAGCESIPDGVTHVNWAFSLIGNGDSTANNEFQGHKDTMKSCIKALHKRCIYSLISVGGADNAPMMATIKDYNKLAISILNLVKEYNMDGVDMDDETTGKDYNENRIINYMSALHKQLKTEGNNFLLTFDGLAYEADAKKCRNPNLAPYIRCFPVGILPYVDWINAMIYNLDINVTAANLIYNNALNSNNTLFGWPSIIGDKTKLVLGVCTGAGCAYGPGPSNSVIKTWANYVKTIGLGGIMIYSGSVEVSNDFIVSKEIINILR